MSTHDKKRKNAEPHANFLPEEESMEQIEVPSEAADIIQRLEAERDEATAARQRALADFANFQRRALENEQRARQQGALGVIRALLTVLDHFDLALAQDPKQLSAEQLLNGIKMVRAEFNKALEAQGVKRIEPAVGEEFDPARHQAVMQQPAPGVPPGHIVSVMQGGYAMGDQVLRPAKVAVSPREDSGA